MAMFIPGVRCALSGRVVNSINEAVVFPPFVANEADPLHVFGDAVMHVEVFRTHPLAALAQARLDEGLRRTAPDARECLVCRRLVTDPDEYLGLGHLIDDDSHPLHPFNYAHFHRSCLATWPKMTTLIDEFQKFEDSGHWRGDAVARLVRELRSVRPSIGWT